MANDIAYFAVKSIGLSKLNGRKPCSLKDAARHNLREIQSELGANGRINATQTLHNWVVAGPNDASGVVSLALEIAAVAEVNLCQKRHDYCQAIELIFSLPDKSDVELHNYFQQCLLWAESAYALPVLSAVVHMDESFPHCHVLLMPLTDDGDYVGSKPLGKLQTKKYIESFFSNVALPAGLRRQGAKMRGAVKQVAIGLILERCRAENLPAANGDLWPIFEAAIKKDPVPFIEALKIDRKAISSSYTTLISEQSNALGIERNTSTSIGIEPSYQKKQTLSSVVITQSADSAKAQNTDSLTSFSRLQIARSAQQNAEVKHFRNHGEKPKSALAELGAEDSLTRVKDEYAHDLSSWDD